MVEFLIQPHELLKEIRIPGNAYVTSVDTLVCSLLRPVHRFKSLEDPLAIPKRDRGDDLPEGNIQCAHLLDERIDR